MNRRRVSGSSTPYSRQWSKRVALQAARPGFRVDLGHAPLAGLLLVGEQLEAVAGRRLEADAPAAALELAGRQVLHLAAEGGQLLAQAAEGGVVDDLEAEKIHARLVGLAQHHREPVDLGPALEIDAALRIPVHLDQPKQIDVVLQGSLHVQHAQLDMARTHYTFFHDDTYCFSKAARTASPHACISESPRGKSRQARARP